MFVQIIEGHTSDAEGLKRQGQRSDEAGFVQVMKMADVDRVRPRCGR